MPGHHHGGHADQRQTRGQARPGGGGQEEMTFAEPLVFVVHSGPESLQRLIDAPRQVPQVRITVVIRVARLEYLEQRGRDDELARSSDGVPWPPVGSRRPGMPRPSGG